MEYTFSSLLDYVKPSPVAELLSLGADKSLISFGGGFPDSSLFPTEAIAEAFVHAIQAQPDLSLQYSVTEGIPSLRQKVADRARTTGGFDCHVEQVMLTQGGTQALDLVASLLLERGDTVVCENPTYMGAMGPFDLRGCRYVGIEMDGEGMDVDRLEAALKAHPEARLIYTIPDFQNPTGVTLSTERRRRVVELANRYDVLVVEDCPYRELRYEGEVQPSLRSFDTEGRVIHLGSFSKVLCPGLRIGYVIADAAIIQKLLMLHSVGDLQCTTVVMYALDRLLEQFDLDTHIRRMCGVYAEKKNRMIALLGEQLPPGATYTNPQGGLFLWLTLPGGIDMGALMREVLVPRARVLLLPGEALFCENPQRNTARLNFSHPSLEKIEQGIASMGRVLREVTG